MLEIYEQGRFVGLFLSNTTWSTKTILDELITVYFPGSEGQRPLPSGGGAEVPERENTRGGR